MKNRKEKLDSVDALVICGAIILCSILIIIFGESIWNLIVK